MNTPRPSARAPVLVPSTAVLVLGLFLTLSCASAPPPAPSTIELPGQTSAQLFPRVTRALVSGGYEIKNMDESAGTIQAFRPMRGTFSRPGYGHNVAILVSEQIVKITAFAMEGVLGGESPQQIQEELANLIRNTN